ncbi:unnamed protein product [Nippostrongylus brasiliensis]|uniref:PH domain-containing protein n=1 Tax=Nippostrongylus brasiliensis TaxID=27835 RepID=A0A0N4YLJ6_NIPBR|nr:unnamed protein product [Nippostrongylus brasiliensis]
MDCSTDVGSGLDRWIQEVLALEYGQQPTIAKKVVMADVQGHMSSILRVHLTWPINSKNLPETVVAKIPTSTAMEKTFGQGEDGMPQMTVFKKATPRDEDHFLRWIHEVEAATYAVLKDGRLDGLAIPYYYDHLPFTSSTPCILMEDIHSSTVNDVVDGFDDAQVCRRCVYEVKIPMFSKFPSLKGKDRRRSRQYKYII